jgi:uncharacterized phage protein gp47/JayE
MPFNRPSLTQIIDRVKLDLDDKLNNGKPSLRRSVIAVFSRVIAAASHILHGHLDWISRQLFPTLADEENLLRWGSIWQVERKPADFAQLTLSFTGAIGSSILAGTELQRSDGLLYTTDVQIDFDVGTKSGTVTAAEAGDAYNTDNGVIFQFVSTPVGLTGEAPVTGTVISGVDQEELEAYRERVLQRIANTPQGGAAADYIRWALEVSGVTRAWVYDAYLGIGTVGLAFVRDGDTPIIPDAGEVQEVQDYIDTRRPLTVDFFAFAPTALAVNFTIDLLTQDTADIRAAVIAELTDLFKREAEPGGTILLSHIEEAISIAQGEFDHNLISPNANVVAPSGQLPVIGAFTWN